MTRTFVTITVAGLIMVSCNKKRTCECTNTNKQDNSTTKTVYTVYTTKKKLKEVCKDYESDTYYEKVSCEIK